MPEQTVRTHHTPFSRQTFIRITLICGFLVSLAATLSQGVTLISLLWGGVQCIIFATIWYLVVTERSAFSAIPIQAESTQNTTSTSLILGESEFLSSMGHDLRQPTQAISLFAATLAAQSLPEASNKLVTGIEDAIHQLSEQMEAVFAIAKIQAGRMSCTLDKIPLEEILENQLRLHLDDAHDKNLHLRHVPTSMHAIADADILSRILACMLAHALYITDEGGIVLGCRRFGNHCRIEVRASSKGIPQNNLSQVFTPGSRYGQNLPDKGLGLVLAHRLAALLDGKFEIRSPQEHGLIISLTLTQN